MSKPCVNSAIILGTRQWGLKVSCNQAAIWSWCCLIQGCLRSPGRGWPPLIQELHLSWAAPPWSLPELHCIHASACHVPCWSGPGRWPAASWLDFKPTSLLWICLAMSGQLADPGYCSAPLLSGCLGAVLFSVMPLPCLPCCHLWLPVYLPLQSRKLWVLPDANSCIIF